jgi:hypothetical protein
VGGGGNRKVPSEPTRMVSLVAPVASVIEVRRGKESYTRATLGFRLTAWL